MRERVAAVAVHEQEAAEALRVQRLEQVVQHRDVRFDAQRRAARIRGEERRDAVREHRQDGNAEWLCSFLGEALREDVVRLERQVRVLFRRPEGQHDAIVAAEVLLELHPVQLADAH
jgi:hypothetical protein